MKEISELVEILSATPEGDGYRTTIQDNINAYRQQATDSQGEIAAHVEDCPECQKED